MVVKQMALQDIAYNIMEALSRKRARTHVFINHELDGFQLIRAAECSKSLLKRKSYLHIGTYTQPPLLAQLIKQMMFVCDKNQIEVVK